MKIFIYLMFGVLLCSWAVADENDFRCFQSVGLKNPLKLQFDFPSENQDLGYVTYQNGSGKIPVKSINAKETRAVPGGRPSEFETQWQEVTPDNSGGKYIIVSQGARIYEFKYIRKKDGKIFKFEEDLESSGEKECEWNNSLPGNAIAAERESARERLHCPFRLTVPHDWKAYDVLKKHFLTVGATCAVELKPKNWQRVVDASKMEMPSAPILIEYLPLSLERAIDAAGIDRVEEAGKAIWIVRTGRATESAEPYSTANAKGLRGFSNYGKFLKDGSLERGTSGYQGLYQFPYIILSQGSGSVVIWAFWLPPKDPQLLDKFLESLVIK
jgi:hypothetical protein